MDRIVFFDIDGTMTDTPTAWRAGAAALLERARHVLGEVDFETFYQLWSDRSRHHFERFMRGEISYVDQGRYRMRDLFASAGATITDEDADTELAQYRADCDASLGLYDDVLPCLDALAEKRLGVITNGQLIQQRRKLEIHQLLRRFDPVLVSEEVGAPKPAAAVFLEAARRAKLPPERCLYVGDWLDIDALGARDAGMYGVWLRRDGPFDSAQDLRQEIPEDCPAAVIETLAELPALVAEWETTL
jgi:putative hydrolase of the HAD superfamily